MDRLQAMKIFARVVDEGGFAAAARAMDMSPPVVTRMVAELEQHLGTRLLQRTTRKLALTDAGDAYLLRVRTILHDIEDAEAATAASTRDLQGMVHVLAPPTLATYFLAPRMAQWRARYPRLLLDIATDNFVAARVDEFDVTFMVVPEGFDGNVVARTLFQGDAIVVASPDYLQRMGVPLEPEDLARHHYLRDSGQAVRAHAGRRLRLQPLDGDSPAREVDVPVVLQSVSTELLLRAALDGVGGGDGTDEIGGHHDRRRGQMRAQPLQRREVAQIGGQIGPADHRPRMGRAVTDQMQAAHTGRPP